MALTILAPTACAMCGKGITSQDGKKDEPVVQGQRFSAK
jgi:hypothetical protein